MSVALEIEAAFWGFMASTKKKYDYMRRCKVWVSRRPDLKWPKLKKQAQDLWNNK